jgi:hypothetical protein
MADGLVQRLRALKIWFDEVAFEARACMGPEGVAEFSHQLGLAVDEAEALADGGALARDVIAAMRAFEGESAAVAAPANVVPFRRTLREDGRERPGGPRCVPINDGGGAA